MLERSARLRFKNRRGLLSVTSMVKTGMRSSGWLHYPSSSEWLHYSGSSGWLHLFGQLCLAALFEQLGMAALFWQLRVAALPGQLRMTALFGESEARMGEMNCSSFDSSRNNCLLGGTSLPNTSVLKTGVHLIEGR